MSDKRIASNQAAWDLAARKYEAEDEFQRDLQILRGGGSTLLPEEIAELGDLSGLNLAIHQCCSHGSEALSLINAGVESVVGIDISERMLALARRKTDLLGAAARWLQADVMAPQPNLRNQADLVYIARGGLPWVADINGWARMTFDLLKSGGRLYIFEGHPLNSIWRRDTTDWRVEQDYFRADSRKNRDFPASAVDRFSASMDTKPEAHEWQWTIGRTVSAIAEAGFRIDFLHERPTNFWPLLDRIDVQQSSMVPQSFSLLASRP